MAEGEAAGPLLQPRQRTGSEVAVPSSPLALLLERATGLRGPSMLVPETAARELEERRANWAHAKPVVALDITWNTVFAVVSAVMLICTENERPNVPIRIWICFYALQCVVHVVLVWMVYRKRNSRRARDEEGAQPTSRSEANDSEVVDDSAGNVGIGAQSSVANRCESMNTMVSIIWWMIGFYWVVSGGETLLQNAPRLFWLTVVLLAFDVIFAVFCVVLACLMGIALCFCFPCIIAIFYAFAGQQGASDADLSTLPRYRFQISYDREKHSIGAGRMVPMETGMGYLSNERILLPEDAGCCICLSQYEDGADLHALPCNHHFHSTCIFKWLKMKAICPLCKYSILEGSEQV